MTITRFSFPTTIHFGPGASRLAGPHLAERGLRRPLVVTDKGLAALPLLAEFAAGLKSAGLEPAVYGGVFGNPTTSQVMNGAAAYRAHGADCVVGIGGGAALDVAKVVGLMATHPGDIIEYVWDHPQVREIGDALPYFVALPTTPAPAARSAAAASSARKTRTSSASSSRRRSWRRSCSPTPSSRSACHHR